MSSPKEVNGRRYSTAIGRIVNEHSIRLQVASVEIASIVASLKAESFGCFWKLTVSWSEIDISRTFTLASATMEKSKDDIHSDIDQEKAAEPAELEQKVDEAPVEKASPAPASNAVVDGGVKGWIVAFGGFCCL